MRHPAAGAVVTREMMVAMQSSAQSSSSGQEKGRYLLLVVGDLLDGISRGGWSFDVVVVAAPVGGLGDFVYDYLRC